MTTTTNLLLQFGSQLASVLTILLNRRPTSRESKEARAILDDYQRLNDVYTNIQRIVEAYNRGIIRSVAIGDFAEVYPLCTYRGYQQLLDLQVVSRQHGVSQQLLNRLEIISVDLAVHTLERIQLGNNTPVNFEQVIVYTRENWTTIYQNGARVDSDNVNAYHLVKLEEVWKIDSNEVFVRSA